MFLVAVLVVGGWLVAGNLAADAAPRQDMVEYGGVAAGGVKASQGIGSTAPASADEPGFQPSDVADTVKDNAPLFIVGVGALMLVGLWKYATR